MPGGIDFVLFVFFTGAMILVLDRLLLTLCICLRIANAIVYIESINDVSYLVDAKLILSSNFCN